MQDQLPIDGLPPIDPAMLAPTPPPAERTAVAVAAALATGEVDLRKIDLKAVALAKFGPWRTEVAALAERFRDVAWDLGSKAGVEALRVAVREAQDPRYNAQKYVEGLKTTLRQISKAAGDELALLQAEYHKVEDPLALLLENHTAAETKAKKARDDAAAARRIAYTVKLDAIRANAVRCEGISAERIAKGIAGVESLPIGDDWEEFKAEAEKVRAETLAIMRVLHDKATREEAAAAETARLADENQRLLAELAVARARLSSAAPAPTAALLKPLPDGGAVDTSSGEIMAPSGGLVTSENFASEIVVRDGDSLQRDVTIRADGTMDGGPWRVVRSDDCEGQAGEAATPATHTSGPTTPDPLHPAGLLQDESRALTDALAGKPDAMLHAREAAAAISAANADDSIETSEAEAVNPPMTVVQAAAARFSLGDPAQTISAIDYRAVLAAALALADHAAEAFTGRFPSQPKPGAGWWDALRQQVDAVRPQLQAAVEAFGAQR